MQLIASSLFRIPVLEEKIHPWKQSNSIHSPRGCKESAMTERLSTSTGTQPWLVAFASFHCVSVSTLAISCSGETSLSKKVRIGTHAWLSPAVLAGSSASMCILFFSVSNSHTLSLDPILTSTANIFLSSLLQHFSPCNAKPMPKDVCSIKQLTELKAFLYYLRVQKRISKISKTINTLSPILSY